MAEIGHKLPLMSFFLDAGGPSSGMPPEKGCPATQHAPPCLLSTGREDQVAISLGVRASPCSSSRLYPRVAV